MPPSQVKILTQSGNALEDERYNEGTDLKLSCLVSGGNILYIDQINFKEKGSAIHGIHLFSKLATLFAF